MLEKLHPLLLVLLVALLLAWLLVTRIYERFYVNMIEGFIFFNLIVFLIITITLTKSDLTTRLLYSLNGIVLTTALCVIVYHFHVLYIAKSALWQRVKLRTISVMKKIVKKRRTDDISTIISHNQVTETIVELREPLLED